MKKLDGLQRERRAKLGRKRHRRFIQRLRLLSGIVARKPQAEGFFPSPTFARKMLPPERLDFDADEDRVLAWLHQGFLGSTEQIKRYHKRKRSGAPPRRRARILSYYDFKVVKTISPAVALVLAALFDRHRQLGGIPMRIYDYEQWAPEVRQVLAQVGFFDLLGIKPDQVEVLEHPEGAKIERFASQSQLDPDELGRLVDTLLQYIFTANPDISDEATRVRTVRLFNALIEATENTRRHAYPKETHRGFTVLPNWWLTGYANPAERQVTLIVYDQGISMPGSLASSRHSDWLGHSMINRVIARFSRGTFDPDDISTDHAKIRLAMKLGQSSTGEAHRGKGLPVVREAIQHCVHGRLHILSRNGGYLEETGKRAQSWQLAHPLPGTLIIWDLKL